MWCVVSCCEYSSDKFMILPSCCRMGGRHLYEVNVLWQWLKWSGLHRTTYKLEGAHTLTNLFCGNKSAFLFLFSFSLVSVHLLPVHVNWGQSPLETLLAVVDVRPPPSLYSLINSLFDTVLKKLSGMPRLSVAGVDMFVRTSDLLHNHHWVTLFQINDQYEIVPKYFIVTEVFACYLLVSDILQSYWKRWKKRYFGNFWRTKFFRFTSNTSLAGFLGCFLS